jgi:hypothetical protein
MLYYHPMTEMNKVVERRTRGTFAHTGRRIIVALEPGDVIAMRLERGRKEAAYRGTAAGLFRVLADWHAQAELRRKREERKQRLLKESA